MALSRRLTISLIIVYRHVGKTSALNLKFVHKRVIPERSAAESKDGTAAVSL